MTVLAIHTGNGITKDIYENARKEVNWEANPPPGLIFHAASFDESDNIRVADIWESQDQWNTFLNTRLKPFMERVKAPALKTEISEVHTLNALPQIDNYKAR
jgi:hypothetical protein